METDNAKYVWLFLLLSKLNILPFYLLKMLS
jgi:hypothetical protein